VELGLLGAFLGGVLTLLSPCSVMLLPAFFSYAFTTPARLLSRTGAFYLGLVTTLVPMGVLAGSLGALVSRHRGTLVTGAAIVVIVLGLLMLANVGLPGLSRSGTEGTSAAAVYALGTVYGLAGVCAGPLLGAVLTVAAVGGNALYGGVVLLVFAAGMTAPLLILALLWGRLPGLREVVRPRGFRLGRWRQTWAGVAGGVLTVAIGVLLLVTDGTTALGGVLGATEQAGLESRVRQATAGVPDAVVAVAALVLAALGISIGRRRKTPGGAPVSSAAPQR
jgi:cytochrome c-type biogenesis protein